MKAFLCVILFILRFIFFKNPPKISKEEEVIHNKIQNNYWQYFNML